MSRKRACLADLDRYLQDRNGNYSYKRRVPKSAIEADPRAPVVRISLDTADLALARAKRDVLETADDGYWAALISGTDQTVALKRYKAAVKLAEAMGFSYRTAREISERSALDEIIRRVEELAEQRTVPAIEAAVLGIPDRPVMTVSAAFELYRTEIVADSLRSKSELQKRHWRKVKQRGVNLFVSLAGDIVMENITRDDAKKLYRHWLERIAPDKGKPTHTPSIGNRDIGTMRVLYSAYFDHMGDPDRENPFARVGFEEKKKRSRPPFPTEWIKTKILAPGALAGLNDEARAIVHILIETGARPSEIANLSPEAIRLDHPVPHISIEPRDDPDDPREIKTESSVRMVPLVGIALDAMKLFPAGFPRYQHRDETLSATLNKFFRENKLFPTPKHKIYSLRHSFEDRAKEGGVDEELRRILMGHSIDRPKYGSGGSLEWRMRVLERIAFPFDPACILGND